jgi:hypothetical protein
MRSTRTDAVYPVLVHPYARTLLGVIPIPGPHRERPGWKVRGAARSTCRLPFLTRGRCRQRSRRATAASAARRIPVSAISPPTTLWPATSQDEESPDEI